MRGNSILMISVSLFASLIYGNSGKKESLEPGSRPQALNYSESIHHYNKEEASNSFHSCLDGSNIYNDMIHARSPVTDEEQQVNGHRNEWERLLREGARIASRYSKGETTPNKADQSRKRALQSPNGVKGAIRRTPSIQHRYNQASKPQLGAAIDADEANQDTAEHRRRVKKAADPNSESSAYRTRPRTPSSRRGSNSMPAPNSSRASNNRQIPSSGRASNSASRGRGELREQTMPKTPQPRKRVKRPEGQTAAQAFKPWNKSDPQTSPGTRSSTTGPGRSNRQRKKAGSLRQAKARGNLLDRKGA